MAVVYKLIMLSPDVKYSFVVLHVICIWREGLVWLPKSCLLHELFFVLKVLRESLHCFGQWLKVGFGKQQGQSRLTTSMFFVHALDANWRHSPGIAKKIFFFFLFCHHFMRRWHNAEILLENFLYVIESPITVLKVGFSFAANKESIFIWNNKPWAAQLAKPRLYLDGRLGR